MGGRPSCRIFLYHIVTRPPPYIQILMAVKNLSISHFNQTRHHKILVPLKDLCVSHCIKTRDYKTSPLLWDLLSYSICLIVSTSAYIKQTCLLKMSDSHYKKTAFSITHRSYWWIYISHSGRTNISINHRRYINHSTF